jgi:hypothetical protein
MALAKATPLKASNLAATEISGQADLAVDDSTK